MKINRFLFPPCLSVCALACAAAFSSTAVAQNVPGGTNIASPVVTITATDASASEAGDPGRFAIKRGDQTNGALMVWLQISGTATPGLDYQAISNIVVIPDGARTLEIPVIPIDDLLVEGTESVTVRIVGSPVASPLPTYLIGSPSAATVSIADNDQPPPTNRPPTVGIAQPGPNTTFPAGANIALLAEARDPDGSVVSVQFFANDHSLGFGVRAGNSAGTVSSNLWSLIWSNAPAGEITLAAKATDNLGAMTLSMGVRILVMTNLPPPPPPVNELPTVAIVQPGAGATFPAGANIALLAEARDRDGFVASVEFIANNHSLGLGVRAGTAAGNVSSNLWSLIWSNVPAGEYTLAAKASDNLGAMTLSAGVRILVATNPPPPTNNEPVLVSITATDPHASEGLAMWCSNTVVGVNHDGMRTNIPCVLGTNSATFTVRRTGSTSNSLRVYYAIGGTASNGVDYAPLSGVVTIAAGNRSAEIVVLPIDDLIPEHLETVALRLRLPPLPLDPADSPYTIGRPADAAAFIVDNDTPPPPPCVLPDGLFHVCEKITNGCFRVEVTTNLVNWDIICTNAVADGMARHIDCDGTNHLHRFFRITPIPCPPVQP